MRGYTQLPTRARKSEWFEAAGTYVGTGIEIGKPFLTSTAMLEFKTSDGASVLVLPPEAEGTIKTRNCKILAALAGSSAPVWEGVLYLRHVVPTEHASPGAEAYWDVILRGQIMVSVASQYTEILGDSAFEGLVSSLLPYATRISWPTGVPNDEAAEMRKPSAQPPPEGEVWEALLAAIRKVAALEADQITPDTRLNELGMDSLDAVVIIMDLEYHLSVDFDEDHIEEIFSRDNSLREICRKLELLNVESDEL